MKSIRKTDPSISLMRMFKELYTFPVANYTIEFLVVGLAASIYLVSRNGAGFIVPVLSIILGLVLNSMNGLIQLPELTVGGWWFLGSGFFILLPETLLHPLISIIITFGCGFIVLALAGYAITARQRRKELKKR